MMDHLSLLRSLGLTESEAKVYLVSLEIGAAQAQVLVKRSEFSRPATYVAIDALQKKGLLSSQRKGKRRLYSAEPPERLVAFAESQARAFQTRIQQITEAAEQLRFTQQQERPVIKFYEGIEGLKSILLDIATSKVDSIDEVVNLEAVRQTFHAEELKSVQRILNKKKTKGRALFLGEVKWVREGVEARILPQNLFAFEGDIILYGDKIALVTFSGKIIGAVIENHILANTYRTVFELAWKAAQVYPSVAQT